MLTVTVAGLRVRLCHLNRSCVVAAHSSTLDISPGLGGCVACVLIRVEVFVTPWTVARQAPLSMGFSRHEDWSGLPLPPPGGLLTRGWNPRLLRWWASSLPVSPLVSLSLKPAHLHPLLKWA